MSAAEMKKVVNIQNNDNYDLKVEVSSGFEPSKRFCRPAPSHSAKRP